MNIKVTKKIVEKDTQKYINFYLDIEGVKIAIKPTFKNDFYVLSKLARFEDNKEE